MTGVPVWQAPAELHTSAPLQALPSLHDVPATTFLCVQTPFAPQTSVVQGLLSLQLCVVQPAA